MFSFSTGRNNIANGYSSHVEGVSSQANGHSSHAEGNSTKANGYSSHAEGSSSRANGNSSHAEGCVSFANGSYSHAQNHGTIAAKESQTAIGSFNIEDTYSGSLRGKYAFIIGNGVVDSIRSNAFTVEWDGNVQMALNTSADSTTTDGKLYAAINALGWVSEVID